MLLNKGRSKLVAIGAFRAGTGSGAWGRAGSLYGSSKTQRSRRKQDEGMGYNPDKHAAHLWPVHRPLCTHPAFGRKQGGQYTSHRTLVGGQPVL